MDLSNISNFLCDNEKNFWSNNQLDQPCIDEMKVTWGGGDITGPRQTNTGHNKP